MIDPAAPPKYQVIADKALHLTELGLNQAAIARRLGVTGPTVKKAVAWARARESAANSGSVSRPVAPPFVPKYQAMAEEAGRLRELGMTYQAIARRLGVTGPTAKRAVAWARAGMNPEGSPDGRSSHAP